MAKEAVKTLSMTFAGTSYKVRETPPDAHKASEPIDVTCLDDTSEQYLPGALVTSQEFEVTINGPATVPAINTVGDVVFTLAIENGSGAAAEKTVTIPACILNEVEPAGVSAGGDRVHDYTLTFRPSGGAVTVTRGNTVPTGNTVPAGNTVPTGNTQEGAGDEVR